MRGADRRIAAAPVARNPEHQPDDQPGPPESRYRSEANAAARRRLVEALALDDRQKQTLTVLSLSEWPWSGR
jgi:hypothetical protein